MNRTSRLSVSIALAALVAAAPAQAGNVRSPSRANVNSNRNINVNRNKNVNVNSNRNVNVNVDRDVHVHGGGYYGGCCYHDNYHPVATAAAVTATAMVTAAVVGSIVNTVPSGCSTVIVNGFAYQQCGTTWYQLRSRAAPRRLGRGRWHCGPRCAHRPRLQGRPLGRASHAQAPGQADATAREVRITSEPVSPVLTGTTARRASCQ